MRSVENIYDALAIEAALKKVKEGTISPYTKNFFTACKHAEPVETKDLSLEAFANGTSNWNPGKCGIGEKAQILYCKENKFPLIETLSTLGDASISFCKDTDGTLYLSQGSESNITNVKSFDAYNPIITNNAIELFMCKTVDIGTFSTSTGGGHQKSVKSEVFSLIETVLSNRLSSSFFRGLSTKSSSFKKKDKEMKERLLKIEKHFSGLKDVKIIILIDGRSADSFIKDAKSRYQIPNNITITKSEDL